jgi:hypothetical protein
VAYRNQDDVIRLERELAEAHERVANLRIENAILASRKRGGRIAMRASATFIATAAGTWIGLALAAVAYLVTSNAGMMLFGALMGILGGTIVGLIGVIGPGARGSSRGR